MHSMCHVILKKDMSQKSSVSWLSIYLFIYHGIMDKRIRVDVTTQKISLTIDIKNWNSMKMHTNRKVAFTCIETWQVDRSSVLNSRTFIWRVNKNVRMKELKPYGNKTISPIKIIYLNLHVVVTDLYFISLLIWPNTWEER